MNELVKKYINPPIHKVSMALGLKTSESVFNFQVFNNYLAKKNDIYNGIYKFNLENDDFKKETSVIGAVYEYVYNDVPYYIHTHNDRIILEVEKFYTDYDNIENIFKDILSKISSHRLLIDNIEILYTNIINIPLPIDSLEDYLTCIPPVPKMNQNIEKIYSDFASKVTIHIDAITSFLSITHRIIPPQQSEKLSVQLDIGLSKAINYENSQEFIWNEFRNFRPYKNQAFEGCITDKTRGMFL